jgi:hypothetical protein
LEKEVDFDCSNNEDSLSNEEKITYRDEREMLVIHRSLSVAHSADEWLRNIHFSWKGM